MSRSLGDWLVAPNLHHCERFPGTTAHEVAIRKQNLGVQLGEWVAGAERCHGSGFRTLAARGVSVPVRPGVVLTLTFALT